MLKQKPNDDGQTEKFRPWLDQIEDFSDTTPSGVSAIDIAIGFDRATILRWIHLSGLSHFRESRNRPHKLQVA